MYGVISSSIFECVRGGLDFDEAVETAKKYTKDTGIIFGFVEIDRELNFETKNIIWICNTLFEDWKTKLKVKPYTRFNKHKNLIAICCCDINFHDDCGYNDDEIVCVMEKKECKRLANLIWDVHEEDFDRWIKDEYTSDQSKIIIDTAIKNGKVLTVYK